MQRRRVGALGVAALLALTGCMGGGEGPGPSVGPAPSGDASPQPSESGPAPEPSSSSEPTASSPADPESSPGGVVEEVEGMPLPVLVGGEDAVEAEAGVRPPVVFAPVFPDGPPKSLPEELDGFALERPKFLPTYARGEYYPDDGSNLDGFDLHVYTDDLRFKTVQDITDPTTQQFGVCGVALEEVPQCVAFTADGAVKLAYFGDEGSMSFEELDGHLGTALEFFGRQ